MKTLYVFALSALAISCSKTSSQKTYVVSERSQAASQASQSTPEEAEALKDLMTSDRPNVALGNIILKTVPKKDREDLKKVIATLSDKQIQEIVEKVQEQNNSVREFYLYHGMNYKNNRDLIAGSLNTKLQKDASFSKQNLEMTVFTYAKDKNLENLLDVYRKRTDSLSNQIGSGIAFELGLKSPELLSPLKKSAKGMTQEEFILKVKQVKQVAVKIDEYFASTDLSEKDQTRILMTGAIIGGMYLELNRHSDFSHFIKEARKAYQDSVVILTKVKEGLVLLKSMENHFENTKKNLSDLNSAFFDSKEIVLGLQNELLILKDKKDAVSLQRYREVTEFLAAPISTRKPTALSGAQNVNERIIVGVNAAANITDNLSNILTITEKFAQIFRVQPSKDLQKVMETAKTVSVIAGGLNTAVKGYMVGGPIGALGALSSNPAISSLMGGSGGNEAEFAGINRKLDEILVLQKQMISMQYETMKMIRSLALVVDENHRKEMAAMAGLRDNTLVSNLALNTLINEDISGCDTIINFNDTDNSVVQTSYANYTYLKSMFEKNITDQKSLMKVFTAYNSRSFYKCNDGLLKAFGSSNNDTSPVQAAFSSNGTTNFVTFENSFYKPALKLLASTFGSHDFSEIPLHIPASSMRALDLKQAYISTDYNKSNANIYDMDVLLSASSIDRYVTSLLIFHPYLTVNSDVWGAGAKNVVNEFLSSPITQSNQSIKLLKKALRVTQTALAQETLLAGEPILAALYERRREILSNDLCRQDICKFRANKLLMRNFLMYVLHKDAALTRGYAEDYQYFYKSYNMAALEKMLEKSFGGLKLVYNESSDSVFLRVPYESNGENEFIEIQMPTVADFQERTIYYSEDMQRLMNIQNAVLVELEKVSATGNGDELLKVMLMNEELAKAN